MGTEKAMLGCGSSCATLGRCCQRSVCATCERTCWTALVADDICPALMSVTVDLE
jgi:hypothetical protein